VDPESRGYRARFPDVQLHIGVRANARPGTKPVSGGYSQIGLDWYGFSDVRCAPVATEIRIAAK